MGQETHDGGEAEEHIGWAVAVTAYRESDAKIEFRTRAYAVGTFHQDDAEEYAREESERLWPQSDGWSLQVAAIQLVRPL
jgi:hypothetical protein